MLDYNSGLPRGHVTATGVLREFIDTGACTMKIKLMQNNGAAQREPAVTIPWNCIAICPCIAREHQAYSLHEAGVLL